MLVKDKEKKATVSSKQQKLYHPELDRFLESLVELWGQVLEFENCGVFLWNKDFLGMNPLAWVRPCEEFLGKLEEDWTKQIADQLIVEKKILIARDLLDNQRSLILAPYKSDEEDGTFIIWSKKPKESFTAKEMEMISSMSEQLNLYTKSLELQRKLSDLSIWLDDSNEHLQQVGKLAAVGELTAGIAHEINNPLQIILGKTQLLTMRLSRLTGNAKHIDALQVIEKNATRISSIIKNLADFARGKGDDGGLNSDVNIKSVLKLIQSLVKSRFETYNIRFSLKTENDLPAVKGNANQIEQLLLNLVLNAKDSMPKGGKLDIDVRREGSFVSLKFKDTRPAIPRDRLENIFKPFGCVSQRKGLGLGLYACHQIVRIHKGEIKINSEEKEGTVFTVKLPAV